MRFRLTFITGMSLLFMAGGLYVAFADVDGYLSKRYFFGAVGVLGWFIGNRLIELEERIRDLEKPSPEIKNTDTPLSSKEDAGP